MKLAIETKYLSPTDHKGASVRAKTATQSVTIAWDHALGIRENHMKAMLRCVFIRTEKNMAEVDCNNVAESLDGNGYIWLV